LYPYIHSYLFTDYVASYFNSTFARLFHDHEIKRLEKSKTIIANTSRTKKYLHEKGFEYKNIEILYPGAEPVYNLPLTNRKNFIIASTRWESDRKLSLYLELAELIARDRLPLKILLSGEWPNKYLLYRFLKNVEKRNLNKYMKISGQLTEHELLTLYSTSIVYIFGEDAVFGMGALEAGMQGTPVVVSAGSGIWEIYSHGVHGYRAKKDDPYDFYKGILNVIDSWENYHKNIYIESLKYAWTEHFKKLLQILNR
jgi:glycosyltransferase involved in cell wall biosynthesis